MVIRSDNRGEGGTTLAFGYVAHYRWGWRIWKAVAVCTPILAIDLLFFVSNLLKFTHGGDVPVAIAAVLMTIMLTWQWGRTELAKAFFAFGVQGGKKIRWSGPMSEARSASFSPEGKSTSRPSGGSS